MTTPHEPGPPPPTADPDQGSGTRPHDGPRVTRDQVKDIGRLRRSADDRKIAGVAGGIARHLDVDPLVVRIAFVVLVFFGGGGLLLYAACWVFVPDERTDQAVINIDERSRTVVLAIATLLAAASAVGDSFGGWGFPWPLAIIGAVVVLFAIKHKPRTHPGPLPGPAPGGPQTGQPTTAVDPMAAVPPADAPPQQPGAAYAGYRPPPAPRAVDPRKRGPILFWFTMALAAVAVGVVGMAQLAGLDVPGAAYPATVLAVCAVMLLVGAFFGRAGGLIFVGLVAALMTVVASVGSAVPAGQIQTQPTRAADIDDSYRLGAGEITIDLTGVEDLEELDGRTLELYVRFGRVEVIVPAKGLDIDAKGWVEGGEVLLFGDRSDAPDDRTYDGGDGVPELTIDAEVFLGQIEIETVGSPR